jgi:hypothetical protein
VNIEGIKIGGSVSFKSEDNITFTINRKTESIYEVEGIKPPLTKPCVLRINRRQIDELTSKWNMVVISMIETTVRNDILNKINENYGRY